MKIAFVLHQFLPFYNSGTEQYVYHLAKRLIARGESVQVFSFEPKVDGNPPFTGVMRDSFENIPVTRVSGWMGYFPNIVLSHFYNPFFGNLFGEFLRKEKIELVHSFQNQRLSISVLEQAYLAEIPCVVNLMDFWYLCPHIQLLKNNGTLCNGPFDYKECIRCRAPHDATYQSLYPFLHSAEAPAFQDGWSRPVKDYYAGRIDYLAGSDPFQKVAAMAIRPRFIRETLEKVDALISPSVFLRSMFVKNGYDPDRFTLIRYGIERDALAGIEKVRTPHLRVGFVGTITAHKGLDILVQAVRRIPGNGLTLEVHGDLKAFPEYAARVQEMAAGDDRIRFHGRFEALELAKV
ncbi:MAG: glycosyltransferase, partial [Planctomycetes bacterium]|nr:glycosyltransferase [Planctomycetota bacterium]